MMAAGIPSEADGTDLDQEIADLWADGFDTVDIAEALKREGYPIGEARVCRVLAKEREGRRANRETKDAR